MAERSRLLVLLCVAVFVAHALSYGLNVQDDAFISFRYAANLAAGDGLVFNPGERVEGFTNFGWTVGLAGVIALGGDPIIASVIGGVGASAVLVGLVWRIGCHRHGPLWALLPAGWLALDAPHALEAVQGLETSAFALLVTAGVWLVLRELEQPQRPPWSAVVLALAALTRPEGVLVFAVLSGIRALSQRPDRRVLAGWCLFVGVVAAQLALRWAYYGQLLPNTFYAKTGGGSEQVLRGVGYVWGFVQSHPVLTVAFGVGALRLLRAPRSPWSRLSLGLVGVYLAYVAAVGGDFKVTARFIQPVMPLVVLIALEGVHALRERRVVWGLGSIALVALELVPGWRQMSGEATFRGQVMRDRLAIGELLAKELPPDAVLAIHSAGAVPYASGLYTIDMWGLTDPHIARVEIDGMGSGMAGHEKLDYAYVFGRNPDVYLPEVDYLTAEPVALGVPAVPGIRARYVQRSVPFQGRSLNLFLRRQRGE